MKRRFCSIVLAALLLVTVLSPANSFAANLRAEKVVGSGHTCTDYYDKNNKYQYSKIDLVIKYKVGGSVFAGQLKNPYRPAAKDLFYLGGKETIAYRKSGKTVRLNTLKVGTKLRVTYDGRNIPEIGYLFKSSGGKQKSAGLLGSKIYRIELR